MQTFIFHLLVTFLSLSHDSTLCLTTTSDSGTARTSSIPTPPTMADRCSPTRIRGRGRTIRLASGPPRGGRTGFDPRQRPEAAGGGSPIATYLAAAHDTQPNTEDTITTFTQVTLCLASHSITVKQEHVENTCGGLDSRTDSNNPHFIFTASAHTSLAEQLRYSTASAASPIYFPLLHSSDPTNSLITNSSQQPVIKFGNTEHGYILFRLDKNTRLVKQTHDGTSLSVTSTTFSPQPRLI